MEKKTRGDIGNESSAKFSEKHKKIKAEKEKKSPSKPIKKKDPLKSPSHLKMMKKLNKMNPYK